MIIIVIIIRSASISMYRITMAAFTPNSVSGCPVWGGVSRG